MLSGEEEGKQIKNINFQIVYVGEADNTDHRGSNQQTRLMDDDGNQ